MRYTKMIIIGLSTVLLSACILGNDPVIHHHRNTTTGQELIDLQKAKDSGVISETEFGAAKRDILSHASDDIEIDVE